MAGDHPSAVEALRRMPVNQKIQERMASLYWAKYIKDPWDGDSNVREAFRSPKEQQQLSSYLKNSFALSRVVNSKYVSIIVGHCHKPPCHGLALNSGGRGGQCRTEGLVNFSSMVTRPGYIIYIPFNYASARFGFKIPCITQVILHSLRFLQKMYGRLIAKFDCPATQPHARFARNNLLSFLPSRPSKLHNPSSDHCLSSFVSCSSP